MRLALFTLILLFAMTGNAQEPQQTQQDPTIDCGRKLANEPRFAAIAAKLPLASMSDMTLEMLANQKRPTLPERKAIAGWVQAHEECIKAGQEYRQRNYPPQIIALVAQADDNVFRIAADLYSGTVTYGQANKRLLDVADDVRNKIAAIVEQIQNQSAAEQQAQKRAVEAQQAARQRDEAAQQAAQEQAAQEWQAQVKAAQRQAVVQMLLRNMHPYQIRMPPPAIQTNCSRYGNQVSCTTQ